MIKSLGLTVKVLAFVLSAAGLSYAQKMDGCIVSSFSSGVNPKAIRELENKKPNEIGKIDISSVGEGSRFHRNIKIPGTGLFAYVEIYFDDDLSFYGNLTDAISVYLIISNTQKRSQRSVLAFAVTQSAYSEAFKRIDLTTRAMKNNRVTVVKVVCTVKKPIKIDLD